MSDINEEIEEVVEPTVDPIESPADQASEVTHEDHVEPAAYEPDFTYKAYDESGEFPEWMRETITDKDREDEIRGIYAKSLGLDGMKTRYEGVKGDLVSEQEKYSKRDGEYNQLYDHVSNVDNMIKDDLDMFFHTVGLTPEKIFEWTEKRLDTYQDPTQQQQYQDNLRTKSDYGRQAQETNFLRGQNEQLLASQNQTQLQLAMQDQGNADFKANFEKAMGDGKFLDEVSSFSQNYYQQNQKHMSPVDAIAQVKAKYQPFMQSAPANAAPVEKPAVIPNLGSGSGGSPVKRKYKSFDELRAAAQRMRDEAS